MTKAPPAASGWIVTVGATALYGPRYEGAGKYGIFAVPSIGMRRANEPRHFSAPDDGFDIALYRNERFSLGPVARLDAGRSSRIDGRLTGLDNYSWTLGAGVFADYWPVARVLRSRIELLHGLRGRDGFIVNLSADLVHESGAWTLSGGPRLSAADSNAMQSRFGITPVAALRNGLVTPFNAGAGVKSVGFELAASYDWSANWQTTVFQRYDRLVGDAASSPITRLTGSVNQLTIGVGAKYSFRVSGF